MTNDQEHILEDEILRLKLLYRRCKKALDAADAESDTDLVLMHQAEMEQAYRLADAIAEGLANTHYLRALGVGINQHTAPAPASNAITKDFGEQ